MNLWLATTEGDQVMRFSSLEIIMAPKDGIFGAVTTPVKNKWLMTPQKKINCS